MDSIKSFKQKLDDEYQWPALYTFKFITPIKMVPEVKQLFTSHDIIEKSSSKGNYIGLTINLMAKSSDQVISYYLKVHELGGGIISL